MTTAHRPTWAPAVGGEEQGGTRMFVPSLMRSAKDQTAHTQLKFRQEGQAAVGEVAQRDLRAELEEKERSYFSAKKGVNFEEERQKDLLLLEAVPDGGGGGRSQRPLVPKAIDADESEADSSDDDDDDDDDEDDEAALMAELGRIKQERAVEAAKKAAEEAVEQEKTRAAELVRGNPLLTGLQDPTFAVKRRWDDDVVFKNQSRGEPKPQKRFVNDTIRSDFHRRFLQRYIR